MAASEVELFFDLGSPYAYLAVARAERVLGQRPLLRPVLLGAIFKARGYGSWSASGQRQQRIAEIEARAANYGLPLIVWPAGWPLDGLAAMRACVWAEEQGKLDELVDAVFEHEFGRGEDVSGLAALAAIADEVGLPGAELEASIDSGGIKLRLRELTDEAWERGVRGIPSIAVGSTVIYGDDQLEQVPLILSS